MSTHPSRNEHRVPNVSQPFTLAVDTTNGTVATSHTSILLPMSPLMDQSLPLPSPTASSETEHASSSPTISDADRKGSLTNSLDVPDDSKRNTLFSQKTWGDSFESLPTTPPPTLGNISKRNSMVSFQLPPSRNRSAHRLRRYSSASPSLIQQEPTPTTNPETPSMSALHKASFVVVACLAQFLNLCALMQTVSPVLELAEYYRIKDYGTLSWFSAAYSLTVGAFILPAGRLGDMYGHKRMLVIGWLWFGLWSFLCGFAYSSSSVIPLSIMRAFQGMGPALMVPNAIALLGRNFAVGTARNAAFACFGAAGPTGAAFGSLFSSLISEYGWWPWCFWVLTIVCIIVSLLSIVVIPGSIFASDPARNRPKFDYWGALTGVVGLILINFALNQAPLDSWTTWYIPSILILGFSFMFAFVMIELNFTDYPLVPIRGLGSEAWFALGCIILGWGSHGIWLYYLYLILEQVRHFGAFLAAVQVAPVAITGVCFALSTVYLVKRFGVSWVMLAAMANFTIGSILIASMPGNQIYWIQTFLSMLIMPGAMNLSFPAATILLSTALPKEKQGIAASLVTTMVNYSISCGLGLAGSVHRHTFEAAMIKHDGPDAFRKPQQVLSITPPGMEEVLMQSFRGPLWFAVGLAGVGVLLAAGFIVLKGFQGVSEQEKAKLRPKSMMFFPKAMASRVNLYRESLRGSMIREKAPVPPV